MIVVDTSAMIALIDRDDPSHGALREAFEAAPGDWILPWAILPEVDYLISSNLGEEVAVAFRADLARGLLMVEWAGAADLLRAQEIDRRYADLSLGLVDSVVMAMAERLEARAIATLDLRDFGSVELKTKPAIWPRDLRGG